MPLIQRLNRPAVSIALLPLAYAGLHATALALAPRNPAAVSLGFQVLAPTLALIAALNNCRSASFRPSDGWSMVAVALLFWTLGMAAPVVQSHFHSCSILVTYADILLFVLYAAPLT